MFKLGIYCVEQLNNGTNRLSWLGDPKRISISLFDKIQERRDYGQLSEQILLYAATADGVYKRTYCERYEAFDQVCVSHILQRYSPGHPLALHDIGISDGRSIMSLYNKLSEIYPYLKYYGSDVSIEHTVIKSRSISLVLNSNGVPIEIVYPPFVLSLTTKESRRYFGNNIVSSMLKKFVLPRILREYKTGVARSNKLLILDPQVRNESNRNESLNIITHNVLDNHPYEFQFEVVRIMNLLNPTYFKTAQIIKIISNIYDSIRVGGLVFTGSNQNSNTLVDGTIFVKHEYGFKEIFSSGAGSPVKGYFMSMEKST